MSTILVIEDNEAIGENIVELLEIFGFNVKLATDGQTGLNLVTAEHPDLLFCDLVMPGMDGYEVIKTLRADTTNEALPVYLMTAQSEPVDLNRGMALGATGYIVKPFLEEDLLNCVCRHLELPLTKG